ncbi:zinc finger protein 831 [Grus japonensis]|uniref:Zinc finger protein 831 n=1 Tax=Grus japonensis TaxID=30415 RepID=A0ABC9XK85_GRUJA
MSHQGSKGFSSTCEDKGVQKKQMSSETSAGTDTKILRNDLSLPTTSDSSFASENHETTSQSFSSKANQGVPEREPQSLSSPGALPNGQCQRKKIQEQRTPTANKHIQLQRQQATSSEKQWDYKPFDCKLKKCESTDSGYLSRSDSTEQQMASSSPLHSLYEHSTELENETAFSSLRCASGSSAKLEAAEKATALMLEKKRLEEHISKLISHNKSVVDDTQLDNVRPRKTVLSKQGSIDLPMPYTYKDSFHFDIRTCDVNRRKNLSLCSAKSTFAPLEKCKAVFFHSVPTQFSTTIDTVPVTRSNSLPFVEGTRIAPDKAGCSKPLSLTKQSVNTGTASLLPSNNLAANSVDFPNSHPRALVRQTAVDDLPLSNVVDHPPLSEELQGSKKLGAGEVISAKNKKHNQRKLKMFSQEKWQMYGDETFKKIYQKMKSSQNARKIKPRGNITSLTPDSKESASSTEITEDRDGRSSVSDSLSSLVTTALNTSKSETCTNGNHILQNVSSEETADSVTYIMETSHSVNASARTEMSKTSQDLGSSNTDKYTSANSALLAPSSCELRVQNTQCQLNTNRRSDDCLPVQSSKWDKPSPGKESSPFESDFKSTSNNYGNHGRNKETGQHALTPPWVHCNNREAAEKSQNLPSERKKLKFEVEQTQKIISKSCPSPSSENNALSSAAPGGAFKNISEQKKKTVVCKKEKLSTNKLKRSHKQKKIKVTPKWYRGRHGHGYAQLKMNRLGKRHCFPNRTLDALKKGFSSQPCKIKKYKKCHSPQSKVPDNYLHQQKDTSCSTSDKALCRRKKEGKNNSGIFSHTENLNQVKQKDKMDKKDISGHIREHTRTNFSFQNITAPREISMTAHSCSSTANTAMQQGSSDVEICWSVTQPRGPQQLVPGESQPNVQSDSTASSFWSYPSDFTNTGTGDQLDSTNSETTSPLSLHREASQENILQVESESQRLGTSDSVIQASGREKPPTEENTYSSPKENSTPSSQPGYSCLFGSKAESLPESVTRAKSSSTEYTERANFSQNILDLHRSADKNGTHLQSNSYGRPCETATTTFKEPPVTLRSSEFQTYSTTLSKTYKKRGLEMMRKQTRVEYEDTSSDDEDRLVIEI